MILVVGGGPAALAAVRGLRDAGGTEPVVLVTDDDRAPYRRPPLSKEFLRGELPAAELQLEEDAWYARHGVELLHDRVAELDADARRAVTAAGRELRFDAAVLATGAAPSRPPIEGADLPGVHVLRSARDSEALRAAVGSGTRVAVVGSGFIGCEAAVSLARRGAAVTLLSDEEAPQAGRLGDEVGALLAQWLREEGVELRLGAGAERIVQVPGALRVDDVLDADVVLLGAGVAPQDELARAAGLALGPDDAFVAVDEGMATSAPGVLAAGDVTYAHHPVAGRPLHVEHWGEALAHGEVAGRRLAGDRAARWDGVPGFWSAIGDRTLKLLAWGDGHEEVRVEGDAGGFVATYVADGRVVGVLAHERDDAYEAAEARVAAAERA